MKLSHATRPAQSRQQQRSGDAIHVNSSLEMILLILATGPSFDCDRLQLAPYPPEEEKNLAAIRLMHKEDSPSRWPVHLHFAVRLQRSRQVLILAHLIHQEAALRRCRAWGARVCCGLFILVEAELEERVGG